ncbi:MAG: T9SS type A sorting domain-containing protein [Bacteroidales bacterium]|nr:T9SS type A sorting domain-containing protein [Bacteroidales bacterium]
MKKFFTLLVSFLFAILFVTAQQVEREKVVVEIATGAWCGYCPGAAMGADDLAANGHDVAILEYHNGDPFTNIYSNARNAYYGIGGYPTAHFDGVLEVVGGSASQSMYTTYLPKYNQRKVIPSSFTIDLSFEPNGLTVDATIIIEKVASTTSTNMVLHLAVNESDIEYSWLNQTHMHFVERIMVPDQYGTALDFSGGNIIEINESFNMDASWVTENCELIAFIQDLDTKEILQGTMVSMATPLYNLDAQVYEVFNVPENNCSGEIFPAISIKNWGSEVLTSLTIQYDVNGGDVQTYDWTGTLEFLSDETITLEPIAFPVLPENEFVVYCTNPNGQPDDNQSNDTLVQPFIAAPVATFYRVSLLLKTDASPQETTYEVINSDGVVLYSGGPFTQANAIVKDTFDLYNSDCYQFIMYDAGGDGLVGGFFTVREAILGGITLGNGGEFGEIETVEFEVDFVGIEANSTINEIVQIFPNPFIGNGQIVLDIPETKKVVINIFNSLGKLIYTNNLGIVSAGEHAIPLHQDHLSAGLNFIQVRIGNKTMTEKVLLNK